MITLHTQVSKHARTARVSAGWYGVMFAALTVTTGCAEPTRNDLGVTSPVTGNNAGDNGDAGMGSDGSIAMGNDAGSVTKDAGSKDAGAKDAGPIAKDAGTVGKDAGTSGGDPNDPHQKCVDKINMLRATLSLPPLSRWTDGEACTDKQSAADNVTNKAHGNFGMCQENAQNTCPNWRSVESTIAGCLDQMWAEGPPPAGTCDDACFQAHGHYMNMTNTRYTKVACGFDSASDVWANQNFK